MTDHVARLEREVESVRRAGDERHESYLREFDQAKTSIQRVHDRLDATDKRQASLELQQKADSARIATMEATVPRLERIADAVETLTSKRFWLKAATAIGVAATIGGQIIAFIDKVH